MPRGPLTLGALLLAGVLAGQQANAAIALDRTRAIFNGADKSLSLSVSNQNKELPYLAQAWIEDANGNKIESPLTALPPLQRIEPGAKSQVKIQATGGQNLLAQDKETLFYFNLREIPPKANKPNTLQIALQTRIKLFYRPKAIAITREGQANPYQQKLTLTRQGDRYVVNNPSPYFVTLAGARSHQKGDTVAGFTPVMVPPKGNATLGGSAKALGDAPVLTYINDYGGRPTLTFGCAGTTCTVKSSTAG
ncbi:fimbria/pilus periplasmic chaperone [Serratia proteamaculans]|uniref:Fimbria/pilus periplasmic chaperone n=1 Tax=Serratia proteamaculans TaxID=28151 RepID=A0A5Q2VJD2_SERPR|nr:fimbria/pilus periplasmic chaperone [Serratia proteamaculans]QGH64326.1 fimbria/pilus periplasmic chaperone [Serratia proteamaculans]